MKGRQPPTDAIKSITETLHTTTSAVLVLACLFPGTNDATTHVHEHYASRLETLAGLIHRLDHAIVEGVSSCEYGVLYAGSGQTFQAEWMEDLDDEGKAPSPSARVLGSPELGLMSKVKGVLADGTNVEDTTLLLKAKVILDTAWPAASTSENVKENVVTVLSRNEIEDVDAGGNTERAHTSDMFLDEP